MEDMEDIEDTAWSASHEMRSLSLLRCESNSSFGSVSQLVVFNKMKMCQPPLRPLNEILTLVESSAKKSFFLSLNMKL